MTKSAIAHCGLTNSTEAGKQIGEDILRQFSGESPDALILFASSRHNYSELLNSVQTSANPKVLVGASSAGEFTTHAYEEGAVSAIALKSDDMLFKAVLGRGLRENREKAANELVSSLRQTHHGEYAYKAMLLLTDALAGQADDFVEKVTILTAGAYQLFGGGAGDDANFTRTHVFFGTEPVPDAAVALEILSKKPIGIGVKHAWEPASAAMRVTEADGLKLISLNSMPAIEAFEEFAKESQQKFDRNDPVPFFLHNVMGISTPAGYRLRVPLAVIENGAIQCAADIPVGATLHIMRPNGNSALAATNSALQQLEGAKPEAALFFDCVATRLRLGKEFGFELESVRNALNGAHYAGCNTYGQIARSEGQFGGFHNCTAVVAILPQ